jgi:hypothetical protein
MKDQNDYEGIPIQLKLLVAVIAVGIIIWVLEFAGLFE